MDTSPIVGANPTNGPSASDGSAQAAASPLAGLRDQELARLRKLFEQTQPAKGFDPLPPGTYKARPVSGKLVSHFKDKDRGKSKGKDEDKGTGKVEDKGTGKDEDKGTGKDEDKDEGEVTRGYEVTFEVTEGKYAGRKLWDTAWFTERALRYSKAKLEAVGIADPFAEGAQPNPRVLLNLDVVQHTTNDGKTFHNIRDIEVLGEVSAFDPDFPPPAAGGTAEGGPRG